MVLSDATIARLLAEGRIEIDPYDESLLQPSSVDVRVDRLFRVFHNNRYPFIDVKVEQAELTELVEVEDEHPFVLHPGEFVLGSTLERIRLPDDLVARLEGKSSLGRLGLLIHSTAGFIDPGWDGHVTLELSNVANLPITIYPGMKIGQISFMQMTEPAATPYGSAAIGSKYKGQRGPTASRYWQNFERVVTVLVTGATGFIGPHVVHALRARETPVRALVRKPARATRLASWGVELVDRRRHRSGLAPRRVRGRGHGRPPRRDHPRPARRFRARDDAGDARTSSRRRRRRACGGSCSRARSGSTSGRRTPCRTSRAKWQMEHAVRESGLDHVIFRPSFVFGRDGGVLPTFVRLARLAPVTPIVGPGRQRLQPIWVEDLAEYYALAVDGADGDERDVRARRPRRGDLERVLGAAEARPRRAAAVGPCPVRPDARAGDGDGALAGRACVTRSAHDARARRQRRDRPERGRNVQAAARVRWTSSCGGRRDTFETGGSHRDGSVTK